jgi:hypothetical protein
LPKPVRGWRIPDEPRPFLPMLEYADLIRRLESIDRTLLFVVVLAFVALIVAIWSKYK